MDRAIEIEKASLDTVVHLNSWTLETYENAFWIVPLFSDLYGAAMNAFAFSMELPMHWLAMIAPPGNQRSESSLRAAAPSSTVASGYGRRVQPTAEVLENSMDVAIGAEFEAPGSKVANRSHTQSQSGQRTRAQSAG
jgi:hypothetical protein